MSAGQRVAAFTVGLLAVGALGAGIGAAVGPIDTGSSDHASSDHASSDDSASDGSSSDHGPAHADAAADGASGDGAATGDAAGTDAVQDGYRLALDPAPVDELTFRVLDPAGDPVVDAEVVHTKPLHLIVVGRDLRSYHHLHPEVDAEGTWTVAWPDVAAGSHRVVADLTPEGGPPLVLAADLTVPGPVAAVEVPPASTSAEVPGARVEMTGTPVVGDVELSFTVASDGEPVALDPYLGARGHLVAFRTADLAYSHVHPHDGDDGPVAFTATFPSAGTYRLFLDLQIDGEVHTASFTVEVPPPGAADGAESGGPASTEAPAATTTAPAATDPAHDDGGDDHEH